MTHYYSKHHLHYLAVDCVIFGFDHDVLKLLLIKRKFEPQKGKWSLMGGFLKKDEELNKAAQRILYDLTGLENVFLEQLYTFGELNRDPGERVVSVAYYALLKIDESDKNLTHAHDAEWLEIGKIPTLIFDHNIMVEKALDAIRHRSRFEPIGFELLPEKFTIPQLQRLYEAVFQSKLDSANFRKKILGMKILKKLNEKEKTFSKRGAYYYEFDQEKYRKLIREGFLFEI